MKKNFYIYVLFIILIPIAGEFKFFPFHDSFRVSMGTPIFFFFLLWAHKIPIILPTLIVGITVVAFRVFLDFNAAGNFHLIHSLNMNFPSFFYYFTYSLLFYLMKVKNFKNRLDIIIFLAIFIEICSNIVELSLRYFILDGTINSLMIGEIIIIAIIRNIFVLGIFSMLKLHEAELEVIHQQKQNSHMIFLISGLYEEAVELKKSLQDAENITKNCYNLYRNIQNKDLNMSTEELSKRLLVIAGEVHDIKKDNQRIYAGISKMISEESNIDYMDINEIGNIIINSNKKYAALLEKKIEFIFKADFSTPLLHIYTTLSLINNLVSNSIESIKEIGLIKIIVYKDNEYIKFEIHDDGSGIPEKKRDLIFKPGYTTKYDDSGVSSTGMGLPYVKSVIENLNGTMEIKSIPLIKGTIFTIKLPIKSLTKI
ncbi:MAG: ATP-binding protein [Clostridium sp.]|uniref:ATP-binding protein n=1 Tax=Clostridium sp. TaxID=1506 RepID=UPI0039EA68B8